MNDKRKNKNNVRALIATGVVAVALGAGYMFGTHVEAQTEIPKPVAAPVVETPATRAAVSIQDAFGA
ncbi:MAG: hypothetical protein ABI210_08335, partial [Abditibacteriaceae bacterium]